MARILLVEDDKLIVEALSELLASEGHEVDDSPTQDGAVALACAPHAGYALALVDVTLAQGNGFAVCAAIKAATPQVPVIFLTASGDELNTVTGLSMGADDYVAKPFRPRELLARVKAVLRRSASVQKGSRENKEREESLTIGGLRLDFSSYQAWLHDKPIALTPKEYELLKLLVTNPGRAFSRDELLERIWGYEYYGDTRTVDVHIRHLRAKLKDDPTVSDAIETVRSVGYRFARRPA